MATTTENRQTGADDPTGESADEPVYESPDSEPDDDFWLEQGRKMLTESLASVRNAANSLTTALGALQGIYLGILGFAKFVPEDFTLMKKAAFITPLLPWMIALYFCLQVSMTKAAALNLNSPTDIRDHHAKYLIQKQRYLEYAFWCLVIGLGLAIALIVFRLKM